MKGRIPSLETPPPPYFKGSSRERRVSETPVMPAWTAGIQVRRMRPETSMSTWVPALHAGTTKSSGLSRLTRSLQHRIFKGGILRNHQSVFRRNGNGHEKAAVRREQSPDSD